MPTLQYLKKTTLYSYPSLYIKHLYLQLLPCLYITRIYSSVGLELGCKILVCIYGHAARHPVAQHEACNFGSARARLGPVLSGPRLARSDAQGRAWATVQACRAARTGPLNRHGPIFGPLNRLIYIHTTAQHLISNSRPAH